MKRSPLKRKTPLKRGKPMRKAGKKTLAKQSAMHYAVYRYFQDHGWENSEGEREAFCQISHVFMTRGEASAHHKTARSELRKAGVEDLDAPHRLIVCHWKAHKWIHGATLKKDWGTGRPKGEEEARQFSVVEKSEANALNNLTVRWGDQDFYDLTLYMQGKR